MLQFVLTINVEGLSYSEVAAALRATASHLAAGRYSALIVEGGDSGRIMAEDKETRLGGWHIDDDTTRFGGR